jgi:hypothetical protein
MIFVTLSSGSSSPKSVVYLTLKKVTEILRNANNFSPNDTTEHFRKRKQISNPECLVITGLSQCLAKGPFQRLSTWLG